jgi:hypothetical protein
VHPICPPLPYQSRSVIPDPKLAGVSRLYSANLLTGWLTFMGRFASEVVDIAVPLAQ